MSNTFCFIACVNNEDLYKESLLYIRQLDIPEGFAIECRAVRNARSITSGYNAAMRKSDAKYKIYIHQDVYIINKRFLHDLLSLFNSDKAIGLVGMVGSADIPEDGVWWEARQILGCAYDCKTTSTKLAGINQPSETGWDAKIVDGLIIATQYDLPWREDLFDGWHFYDASQCCEFLRKNHRVLVANQYDPDGTPKPWCLHYIGEATSMLYYEKYRSLFLSEYSEFVFDEAGISEKEATGISVVLMIGDNLDTIWIRMDEVERYIGKKNYELIILVNHLENKTEKLFEQDGIKVIFTGTGDNAASTLNRVILTSEKQYDVLLMDSRISISGSISLAVQHALYTEADIGAVYCSGGEPLPETWEKTNNLESIFTLFKRTALEKTGSFDERFKTLEYSIYDYALRLINGGNKILKRNVSGLVLPPNEYTGDIRSDELIFNEKWDFDRDGQSNPHRQV